jgi:hypothetical protein
MSPSITASGPASRTTAGCKDTRRGPRSVRTSNVQLPPSCLAAELLAKTANRTVSLSTTTSPVESGVIVGGGPAVASTIDAPPAVVGRGSRAATRASRNSSGEFTVSLASLLARWLRQCCSQRHPSFRKDVNLTEFVASMQVSKTNGKEHEYWQEDTWHWASSRFWLPLIGP